MARPTAAPVLLGTMSELWKEQQMLVCFDEATTTGDVLYDYEVCDMPLNELSPSQATAMTSNATPEPVPAATSSTIATPAIVDDTLPNGHLTTVAHTKDAKDDAQQAPSEESTMLLQKDVGTRGLEGQGIDAPTGEGNGEQESQEQQGLQAGPDDLSDLKGALAGLTGNPELLQSLVANQGLPEPTDEPNTKLLDDEVYDAMQTMAELDPGMTALQEPFPADFFSSLQAPMPPAMFPQGMQDGGYYNSAYSQQNNTEAESLKVQGYAKLEFEDGHFYLNSYSLMLGRDVKAQRIHANNGGSHRDGSYRQPKSIISEKGGFVREFDQDDIYEEELIRKRRRKGRTSTRADRRIKTSRSSGSSSHHRSRRPSMVPPNDAMQSYYPDSEVPRKVDLNKHQPDPHKLVMLGLHPSRKEVASDWKGISREHLLIAFNFQKNLWEAHVKGRNGCFVNDTHHGQGDVVALTNGCRLQIGAVPLLWRLPEHIPEGATGAEEDGMSDDGSELNESDPVSRGNYVFSGKEMSLDFAAERRGALGLLDDDSESESSVHADVEEDEEELDQDDEGREGDEEDEEGVDDIRRRDRLSDEEGDDEDEDEDDEEEGEEEIQQTIQDLDENPEDLEDIKPQPKKSAEIKKRGAGRPPKGEKSKRQQKEERAALLAAEKAAGKTTQKAAKKTTKKEDKDAKMAKKGVKVEDTSQDNATGTIGNKSVQEGGEVKRKVGRPRKHPRPETPPEPREKRKYTKRKPKEPKDGEQKTEGLTGDDEFNKESKEQKPPRSPRSPSPTFNEADLTSEQLAKPSCNYVQLIYEALSESTHKQMSLPQIYRAIQRKYPYFVLRVSTLGWQSSVRHNLGQNEGFEKVERDGKGWKWAIKEGATFEKEKKKKAPSPPPQYPPGMQPIYPGLPHGYQMQSYPPHGMMVPPQGYHMNHQLPQNYRPGQPYMGHMGHPPPQHMNGHFQPGLQPPMTGQPPISIPPALAAPVNTSYSSPYGPKPAASSGPQTSDQGASPDERPKTQMSPPATISPQNQYQMQSPYSQPPQPQQPPPPYPSHPYPPQPSQNTQYQTPQQHSQPNQSQPQQIPPQSQPQPVQPQPGTKVPTAALVDERVLKAVESFKNALSVQMAEKPNGKEILDSAVRKVLGQIPDDSPIHPESAPIVEVLRNMLTKIGLNHPTGPPSQQTDHRSPPPPPQPQSQVQQQANHNGTQASASSQPPAKSTGPERPTPTVTRPMFHAQNQNRPAGTSVPRPPMNLARSNSNSSSVPARQSTPSGSPAPPPMPSLSNGASAPKSVSEIAQVQGQGQGLKRPLEDAEENQDVKRLSASGPSPLRT